ncbi:MAG: pilus assembly protein PilM [Phycisphaeraceae bacterium]|nr:MAG: pilus assembly protein PilM [Phycisphaeraceae bacterium]
MAFGPFKKLASVGSGLFQTTSSPIAVDFGVGALKVLQVVHGEAPALVAAASLETPPELQRDPARRLAFQVEAFPRVVRQGGFKGRRAVCAIPASQTFCKHVQLHKAEGALMADQVAAAVASQIGCDPGALVYRHVVVDGATSSAGKAEVICFATPRDLVLRLLGAIKDARLDPVGMHSEFSATLRGFEYVSRRADDAGKVTLYLDIGAGTTKIMIAHGPAMVFARTVELGGVNLDDEIIKRTKCDLSEAPAIRRAMEEPVPRRPAGVPVAAASGPAGLALLSAGMRSGGAEPAPAPAPSHETCNDPDLSVPLEILTDEVQVSLRYHQSVFPGKKVDRIVFVGGESKNKGICQHVARVLRLPAQVADPLARVARTGKEPCVGVDLTTPQPGWAVPLGLCLSPTDL